MSKEENHHRSLIASKNARELHAKFKMACAANKMNYKPIATSMVANELGQVAQIVANRDAAQSIIATSLPAWSQVLIQQQSEVIDIQLEAQVGVTSPLSGQTFDLPALTVGTTNEDFQFYVDVSGVAHRLPVQVNNHHEGAILIIAKHILELDEHITINSTLQELE